MSENKELFRAISEFEVSIGLKQGFFYSLLKEDDWSFVIKIHALYEAAISTLLQNYIGRDELESFISRLELGDKSRGKLRLIKEMELLEDAERKFIYSLSEIRNSFVHNVKNTQINLEDYLNSFDKNKRKDLINTFSFTYSEFVQIAEHRFEAKALTAENPKVAIWHQSIYLLYVITSKSGIERSKRESQAAKLKISELQSTIIKLENLTNA